MKVKKGQTITVIHKRKGVFLARASEDFDTESDEVYHVTLLEPVRGLTGIFDIGDTISCRKNLCKIRLGNGILPIED